MTMPGAVDALRVRRRASEALLSSLVGAAALVLLAGPGDANAAIAASAPNTRPATSSERAALVLATRRDLPGRSAPYSGLRIERVAISKADPRYAAVAISVRHGTTWVRGGVVLRRESAGWRIRHGPGTFFDCATPVPRRVRVSFGEFWGFARCGP
jgi:hypothetical protein